MQETLFSLHNLGAKVDLYAPERDLSRISRATVHVAVARRLVTYCKESYRFIEGFFSFLLRFHRIFYEGGRISQNNRVLPAVFIGNLVAVLMQGELINFHIRTGQTQYGPTV